MTFIREIDGKTFKVKRSQNAYNLYMSHHITIDCRDFDTQT